TLTVSGTFVPSPWYSVEVSVPLLADHHGDESLALSPHELTRFLSRFGAAPFWSETKGVTVYPISLAGRAPDELAPRARRASITTPTRRDERNMDVRMAPPVVAALTPS